MEWNHLTLLIIGSYTLYFSINILLDIINFKKVKATDTSTTIEIEDDEEPIDIREDFFSNQEDAPPHSPEEGLPKEVLPLNETKEDSQENKILVESKKKESKEEDIHEKENEKKDPQNVKFQSMPVSEFLANAKKFSSQIDFS